jgi:hypothetical protein
MEKKFGILKRPPGKYDYLLISKFFTINRGARLTFERLTKIKIGKELLKIEKDLLTEMLYNRKAALA